MLLPNLKNAEIAIEKIRDYSLNEDHAVGQHKALLFKKILGFTIDDSEELMDLIFEKITYSEAILGKKDQFGQRYVVDFDYSRNDRTVKIRTTWIIKIDEDFPRLTSCYIP